jgi:signal-transduction protein with cAMP-binding, CBS, and nucleotidyltransferase domain
VIFHVGDVGHEAYFILKGNVAVMNKHKELLAVLSAGE